MRYVTLLSFLIAGVFGQAENIASNLDSLRPASEIDQEIQNELNNNGEVAPPAGEGVEVLGEVPEEDYSEESSNALTFESLQERRGGGMMRPGRPGDGRPGGGWGRPGPGRPGGGWGRPGPGRPGGGWGRPGPGRPGPGFPRPNPYPRPYPQPYPQPAPTVVCYAESEYGQLYSARAYWANDAQQAALNECYRYNRYCVERGCSRY